MESQNLTTRTSREEQRKARKVQKRSTTRDKMDKSLYDEEKVRIRVLPIWLRIIIVIALCFIAVILGLIIGYAVLGDGTFGEVFQKSTWTHIFDLVLKE